MTNEPIKILVADDEARIRELIRKYAVFSGYAVEEAADGLDAVQRCRDGHFSLLILDVMMPELDGFSVCREIRKFSPMPIILLSARGEEYDRIHGFESGADDYVVKPFSPRELMMRVEAILKRACGRSSQPGQELGVGSWLRIDPEARRAVMVGEPLELTTKEFNLLHYLVINQGIALTRQQLLDEVWGSDFFGDDRTLDTHIRKLRRLLGPHAEAITTLRGVGYRLEKD